MSKISDNLLEYNSPITKDNLNKPVNGVKEFLKDITLQDMSSTSDNAFSMTDDLIYFNKDGESHRLSNKLLPRLEYRDGLEWDDTAGEFIPSLEFVDETRPGDIIVVDSRTKLFAIALANNTIPYTGYNLKLLRPIEQVKIKVTYLEREGFKINYKGYLHVKEDTGDWYKCYTEVNGLPVYKDETHAIQGIQSSGDTDLAVAYLTGTLQSLSFQDACEVIIYDAPYLEDVSHMFNYYTDSLKIYDGALDDVINADYMFENTALTEIPDISLPKCQSMHNFITGYFVKSVGTITAPLATSSNIIDSMGVRFIRGLIAPLASGEVISGMSIKCIKNIEVQPGSTIDAPDLVQPNASELQTFSTTGSYLFGDTLSECETYMLLETYDLITTVVQDSEYKPSSFVTYTLNGVIQDAPFTATSQDVVKAYANADDAYQFRISLAQARKIHILKFEYDRLDWYNMPNIEEFTHAPGALDNVTAATNFLRYSLKLKDASLDMPNVTTANGILYSCNVLRRLSISIPKCTSATSIGDYCPLLHFIDVLDVSSLGSSSSNFRGTTALTINRFLGSKAYLENMDNTVLVQPGPDEIQAFGSTVNYTSPKNLGASKVIYKCTPFERVNTNEYYIEFLRSPEYTVFRASDNREEDLEPSGTYDATYAAYGLYPWVLSDDPNVLGPRDENGDRIPEHYYVFGSSTDSTVLKNMHVYNYELSDAPNLLSNPAHIGLFKSLETFTSDEGAFTNLEDASYMFEGHTALTTQPDIDYSKVQNANRMFYNTSFSVSIDLPNALNVDSMLSGSSSSSHGDFYLPKVQTASSMFENSSVTQIGHITVGPDLIDSSSMFKNLPGLYISKWTNLKKPITPLVNSTDMFLLESGERDIVFNEVEQNNIIQGNDWEDTGEGAVEGET